MDETELLPPYPLGFTIYKDIGFAPEEYLQNLSGGCFFSLLTYALHVESSHDRSADSLHTSIWEHHTHINLHTSIYATSTY